MNRNELTLLIAAIAVTAVIAVASAAISHGEDSPETDYMDLVGHWYVIDAYGDIDWFLTEDGEYQQSSGMDVFNIPDGKGFYGKYMDHAIAGQVSAQGRLEASVSIGDMTTHINGCISDGGVIHIVGIFTITDRDGVMTEIGTYVLQMSKFWNGSPEKESLVDIRGDWEINQALYPNGDDAYIPGYNVNVIQERNRCVITVREGLRQAAEVRMATYVVGNTVSGIGFSSSGNFWILISDGTTMDLDLNLCNDTDIVPSICHFSLGRGESGETAEPVDASLLGTSWRSVHSATYWPDGNTTMNKTTSYMSFEEQNGSTYIVNWNRLNSLDVIVNVTSHDVVTLHIWCIDNKNLVAFHGYFDRETRTLSFTLISWMEGMLCISEITFEERHMVEDVDITGHWYMVKSMGYDEHGTLVMLTPKDSGFDLDIYEVSEGLLYGRFGGSAVTGSYLDGIITIYGDTDFGLCAIEGRAVDNNTIVFTETYFDAPVKKVSSIDSWMTVMSRDLGGGAPEQITIDIAGEWKLSYGKYFDGTTVELKDIVLNITEFLDNVLFGTMKGPSTDFVVKGSILPYGDGSSATGILIHEDGSIWSLIIRDDRIIAKMAMSDDSTGVSAWTVQTVFTRSGEPVADDVQYPDMIGTWRSESITTMDGRGIVEHGAFPYTFEITGQDGFGLVGFSRQPGAEGALSIAMSMTPNGQFTFHAASDFTINDDLDLGFGWLDGEGGMYVVETYVNAAGIQTTQLTYMTLAS